MTDYMKRIYRYLLGAALLTPTVLTTGCIEETFPTNIATSDQLAGSSKSTESMLRGIPAYFNKLDCLGFGNADLLHFDWGYGSIMHIRDVMTADMAITSSGYDHYTSWEHNTSQDPGYAATQFIWTYYSKLVLTCNTLLGAINIDEASDLQKGYYGAALACRANAYLDMARMYEFLPNDGTSPINNEGENVEGLTVPIVTEKTTQEEAKDNPRAPHDKMMEFIMSDLDQAEALIVNFARTDKTMPDLSVVYGLKARAYMWDENYPKAAEYARMAIATGQYSPVTREQWLSTTDGFNTPNQAWMWAAQCVAEDDVVLTGIINWTSWMSNEAQYGYSAHGPYVMIAAQLYENMNSRDFRKLSYKAPEGGTLAGSEPVIDAEFAAGLPAYASYKFRPGKGNTTDNTTGSATAFPLMRVEEMYLIEAEAVAHTSAEQGRKLLVDFMRQYRYATYSFETDSQEDVIDEIFFQKQLELWGEGLLFFDYKRLNKPVVRAYSGTNFSGQALLNTTTRPAWMNFVFVGYEGDRNVAVKNFNNPDPTGVYNVIAM